MKSIELPSFGNPTRMKELKKETPVKIPSSGIHGFRFGNHAEFRISQDEDDRIIYVEVGWRNKTIFQVKFYLEKK